MKEQGHCQEKHASEEASLFPGGDEGAGARNGQLLALDASKFESEHFRKNKGEGRDVGRAGGDS